MGGSDQTAEDRAAGDPEMVYRADGRLELRSGESGDRWIATDAPRELRR